MYIQYARNMMLVFACTFTACEFRVARKHPLNALRVERATIKFKLHVKSCMRTCNLARVHLLTT